MRKNFKWSRNGLEPQTFRLGGKLATRLLLSYGCYDEIIILILSIIYLFMLIFLGNLKTNALFGNQNCMYAQTKKKQKQYICVSLRKIMRLSLLFCVYFTYMLYRL